MVGEKLIYLGMKFNSCVSFCDPFPGLLVTQGIYVELGQEGLDITLVLDGHMVNLELLSEGKLFVAVSLTWWLRNSSTY